MRFRKFLKGFDAALTLCSRSAFKGHFSRHEKSALKVVIDKAFDNDSDSNVFQSLFCWTQSELQCVASLHKDASM